MTPTSDERREVAAMLRESWPEAGGMEEVWEVLDPILGTHDGPDVYKAWEQTFNRLADLIDPTCAMEYGGYLPESVKGMLGVYFCSECGSPIYNDVEPAYCPYCGARVVSGDVD